MEGDLEELEAFQTSYGRGAARPALGPCDPLKLAANNERFWLILVP